MQSEGVEIVFREESAAAYIRVTYNIMFMKKCFRWFHDYICIYI